MRPQIRISCVSGEPTRDFEHDTRTLSPEQHQTRGTRRIEAQAHALRRTVHRHGFVELGAKDHAGDGKHAIGRIAEEGGLSGGSRGSANHELLVTLGAEGFDPEMRRIIREIS